MAREVLKEWLLKVLLPDFWHRWRFKAAQIFGHKLPLDLAADRLLDQAHHIARRVTTNYMMTIKLAEGDILQLGKDLKGPFPDSLTVRLRMQS